MKKALCVFFCVGLALFVAFLGASRVYAQEEGETDTDAFTLEEVTVTATKVAENQQKVDIAMEVLSGENLKEMGRTALDDVLSTVSSAIISRAGDGMRVTIRGISDEDTTFYDMSQSQPTVAVNTDGIRSNRKDNGSTLFDVQRVEVLYGPQSTVYSSNSPAGVVNIVTNQPKLDTYEASGTVEIGNFKLMHTEGVVNIPVIDTIAVRAAFNTEIRDGYYGNGAMDADNKTLRFRTLFQPIEDLSITLTVQHSRQGGNGMFSNVDAFVRQSDVDDPWAASTSDTYPVGVRDIRNTEYNATIDWSTKFGTLTIIPSKSEGTDDSEQSDPFFGTSRSTRDNAEEGVEIRMASSPDFFFKWLVGYNYYKQEDFVFRDMLESEQFMNRQVFEDANAFFANITYPVMEDLRLVAGYRRSWDKIHLDNKELKPAFPVPGSTETPMTLFDESRDSDYSSPDYKVGFEYDLGQQSMIYGNYSTSYRVKGWGGVGEQIKPEKLKAYTLGAKNRFLENRLQVNGSVYYYDYQNYSANQGVTVWFDTNGDGVVQRSETTRDPNGSQYGAGRNMGFDLQVSALISPQDIFNISWSYINSEWTDLLFDYYYDFTQALDEDGNVITVPIEDANYTGKPLTNTPPHTISATYTHNFILPNGSSLRASINSRYQTEYRLSWKDEDYPLNWQESYHMSDASLAYTSPDRKWTLSLWVKNIENYAVKRMFRAWHGMPPVLSIGNPRTYGATLTASF